MGYPSTADLVAASDVEELTGAEPEKQDDYRGSAITAIEGWCRQSFEAEGTEGDPVTKLIDGLGTDQLYTPKRLAVLSSVQIDNTPTASLTVDVDRSATGAVLTVRAPVGSGWAIRSRLRYAAGEAQNAGPVFEAGRENVAVAGVWGWTDEEWETGELAPVARALRFDMEDQALADAYKLSSTIRAARALGVESITQGGLTMPLKGGTPGVSIRVQRELQRFRWEYAVGARA